MEHITITVDRLRIRACHGVFEQERLVGNVYEVTVVLDYPPALEAARSDEISATLNYAEVVALVKERMAEPSRLIEHVCGRIKDELCRRYPQIASGRVAVAKLLPPVAGAQLAEVSVELSW